MPEHKQINDVIKHGRRALIALQITDSSSNFCIYEKYIFKKI